jgi:hypothetical protein
MSDMDPRIRDSSDDELMIELKHAVAEERPAPDRLMEAAKAAFDWRRIDEELELLTLSYDSSLADTAGVRGPARTAPRMLVFDGEHVTVELELGADVLMGQVVPAEPHRIVLESAGGQVDETDTDDAGVFLLRRPAKGPVRLRCWHHDVAVVTEWMAI